MSTTIEWSDVLTEAAYTETPDDIVDAHGNTNSGPALAIGGTAVVEAATRAELVTWLEAALDAVRGHGAPESDDGSSDPLPRLVDDLVEMDRVGAIDLGQWPAAAALVARAQTPAARP